MSRNVSKRILNKMTILYLTYLSYQNDLNCGSNSNVPNKINIYIATILITKSLHLFKLKQFYRSSQNIIRGKYFL